MKILLLYGGFTEERAISLISADNARAALVKNHDVVDFDLNQTNLAELIERLQSESFDLVFNILHGPFGEDGQVQAALNYVGVPYTFSGYLPSALAMDKCVSASLFHEAGLKIIPHQLLNKNAFKMMAVDEPIIVKPTNSGSSCGVHLVHSEADKKQALIDWPESAQRMVQPFIQGREINVAVLDDEVLGDIEVKPGHEFYDYASKYSKGLSNYQSPADISDDCRKRLHDNAIRAAKKLNTRGLVRFDFIVRDQDIYILEANTQPGLTSTSLVPQIAKATGISYDRLIEKIVAQACCDYLRGVSQKVA